MKFDFAKMHGAGNTFVMIDDPLSKYPLIPSVIRRHCSMQEGLGTEGLILLRPATSAETAFRMLFFNPDGSRASMCGNGARCVVFFAIRRGRASARTCFETDAGRIAAKLVSATEDEAQVRVQMTAPKNRRIGLAAGNSAYRYISLDTGVPHAVAFVEDVKRVDVQAEGRAVRYSPVFAPKGTNVDFVQIVDRHVALVRTYERGVEDETGACGTGCTASAIAAVEAGLCESPVTIHTAFGADLFFDCQRGTDGLVQNVFMTGPAHIICEGSLSIELA
ncbi:MAG: diaminopimelate epimerase [Kiritimatiellia bacterium]